MSNWISLSYYYYIVAGRAFSFFLFGFPHTNFIDTQFYDIEVHETGQGHIYLYSTVRTICLLEMCVRLCVYFQKLNKKSEGEPK